LPAAQRISQLALPIWIALVGWNFIVPIPMPSTKKDG
jgi:hypothetical protein